MRTAIVVLITGIVGPVLAGLLTKEVEGLLHLAPFTLLRLARRRLPVECRTDLYDEWHAELFEALHNKEKRPLSRFFLGLRYSLGLLIAARRVAREISEARITVRRSIGRNDLSEPLRAATSRLAGRTHELVLSRDLVFPLYLRRFGTGYDGQELVKFFVELKRKFATQGHLSESDLQLPQLPLRRYGFEEASVELAMDQLKRYARGEWNPIPPGFHECRCEITSYPCKAQL